MRLNYHHLFYFWTAAKVGAIGEAGRKLHLAQPTLSLQLKQLERSLGRTLLERGRRGVKLTAAGRMVFGYCERIFSQGDELAAALLGEAKRPRLNVGVAGPVSRHVVLQALDFVHDVDPSIRMSLISGQADDLQARLEAHKLHMVIATVDLAASLGIEFRSRLAGTVPICLAAKPQVARLVRRFPADLSKVPALLMAPENPSRKDVDLFLCRHSVDVAVDVEVDDAEFIRRLALRGLGAAALDELTAADDLKSGRLVRLNRRPLGINQQIWFTAGRHPKPNPALERSLSALMDRFRVRL